jgi:hypothetical protein
MLIAEWRSGSWRSRESELTRTPLSLFSFSSMFTLMFFRMLRGASENTVPKR